MSNQTRPPVPFGFIQYKGTEVCMDVHCVCGHLGHFDGEFFYFWECSQCGKKYEVGYFVTMFPMSAEQLLAKEQANDTVDFQKDQV